MSAVRARGFTLIEVMLATMLLGLLLAGTYGAIRTTVKAMQSGESAVDTINRIRVAQEFIRRQISRGMPLGFDRDDSTGVNFVFEGKRDFMRFVAPMPGYLSKGGPYVQTLELANVRGGKELVFTHAMLNGFDLRQLREADLEPVMLVDRIRGGRFEYRGFDEEGNLGDWQDDWEDPSLTPVMVRIRLEMADDSQAVFPDMEIPLVLDVGSMRRPYIGRDGEQPIPGQSPPPQSAYGVPQKNMQGQIR
ncbi:MAG TPA: prepilin-type N-terminal cleavage/methylation domain-containing protein [Dokdonella sp.]|uniref:prepilin-type N-terminal cleavage/methylation domain-containing protein n=1 Tax=Dokdonella sp. TaxID=2291710 RepID=UPI002C80E2BA|nr:prepilin-type N-terminal cleavage/methylation domain-containing protein [Dokdonella sp.]HUD43827.1 prepilin-type N-terminal cleavage/methylation domain-containing protein [Dokdonella sp.]